MKFRPLSLVRKALSHARGGPAWRGGPGDMVATLYDDGGILEISPSAETVIGAAGDLVGRSLYDFVRREDRGAVHAALQYAAQTGQYGDPQKMRAEFRLLRVRRAASAAEITLAPIGRGRLKAFIRNRGEEFARARMARATAEREAANPGESAVGADLLADLSHEMKTPLNAIMGFADAMRAETFGPLGHDKYREYVAHIYNSGAHLIELIGAAHEFAKTEAGRNDLNPVLTAPAPIVRDCAEMIRGEAEKAGLALKLSIAPDLPEAMIDARAVKQILINLLSNAVKFTGAGEVELSVEEKCGALDFTVRDTGIGMDRMTLAKLGGRYSDTHKKGVRGAGGSGLGLSLAFSLAKLHGGVLRFTSEPGEGTMARLTLPLLGRPGAALPAHSVHDLSTGDIQSQLDRVNAYRRERAVKAA